AQLQPAVTEGVDRAQQPPRLDAPPPHSAVAHALARQHAGALAIGRVLALDQHLARPLERGRREAHVRRDIDRRLTVARRAGHAQDLPALGRLRDLALAAARLRFVVADQQQPFEARLAGLEADAERLRWHLRAIDSDRLGLRPQAGLH